MHVTCRWVTYTVYTCFSHKKEGQKLPRTRTCEAWAANDISCR